MIVEPGAPSHEEAEVARARFNREWELFDAARSRLMADPQLLGRFVVWLDGEIKHVSTDRREAYRWAVDNVGALAGFVLARVAEPRVVYVGRSPR